MLVLWMCCLSFAQEEKNELGLLLGAEFIPSAATTSSQKVSLGRSVASSVDYSRRLSSGNTALLLGFPFARKPSYTVKSAQLSTITTLATLFVTPSLRAQFVSYAPVSHGYPRASDLDFNEGSSALQSRVANTEMHRTDGDTAIRRGNRQPHPSQTAVADRSQERVSELLPVREPQFLRSSPCAKNSIISSSREDWLSTSSRLRRGYSLVNMEDRMLDRFADHQS